MTFDLDKDDLTPVETPPEAPEMRCGWWSVSIEMFDDGEVSDATLEHITESIKDGYTSGEIVDY